jgi:hypothetical protein
MDEEVAFYIAIEVCVAWEVCVKNKFFDSMCLTVPTAPAQLPQSSLIADLKQQHTFNEPSTQECKCFTNSCLVMTLHWGTVFC